MSIAAACPPSRSAEPVAEPAAAAEPSRAGREAELAAEGLHPRQGRAAGAGRAAARGAAAAAAPANELDHRRHRAGAARGGRGRQARRRDRRRGRRRHDDAPRSRWRATLARDARVVLVDLSLDRPKLAAITLDPRAPGIADLVRGTASFGQIITRDRSSRVQVVPAGRVGAGRRRGLSVRAAGDRDRCAGAQLRSCRHRCRRRAAVPADRIARLAPCAVLVASGLAAANADAMRDHLASAGFTDIAVFAGTRACARCRERAGVAA